MVFLFSDPKSREQREITEILRRHGAGIVSSREAAVKDDPAFLLLVPHAPVRITAENGTAIFTSACGAFRDLRLPAGITGVCGADNKLALAVLRKNKNPAVTCGMDARNALTLSGVSDHAVSVGLQRAICDRNGNELSPAEYPVLLTNSFSRFSVLAAAAALLREGIVPARF